jgi:hypothetical protein
METIMVFAAQVGEEDLARTVRDMSEHTLDFITPIIRVIDDRYGKLEGSGTFLELRANPYILTNEHVALQRETYRLGHFVGDVLRVAQIVHPFRCFTEPTDAAVARIDQSVLDLGTKRPVPAARVDRSFSPVSGEVMFLHGYTDKGSYFSPHGQGLVTNTFPYAVDVAPLPRAYDPDLHFALSYPAQGKVKDYCKGRPVDLPHPGGLSCTLVWDTKFVATGARWTPHHARVAGLVWLWDQADQLLIGTKVEILRHILVLTLRYEASYFNWINRQVPLWDDLTDWLAAEKAVTDIQ